MLDKIINGLQEHKEEFFKYFELHNSYEVSINFISPSADIPTHTHEKEVFNYVLDGEIEITINGKTQSYQKSEWVNITGGASHSVKTKGSATLLELWKK